MPTKRKENEKKTHFVHALHYILSRNCWMLRRFSEKFIPSRMDSLLKPLKSNIHNNESMYAWRRWLLVLVFVAFKIHHSESVIGFVMPKRLNINIDRIYLMCVCTKKPTNIFGWKMFFFSGFFFRESFYTSCQMKMMKLWMSRKSRPHAILSEQSDKEVRESVNIILQ